jgi:L-fuculose-phosphate aldolase
MTERLLAAEREAVAEGSRRLAEGGLVIGTAGNVSVRRDDLVAVTPTGAVLAEVTADMVSVVDLDGRLVDGDLAPTSEIPLHTGIYRATNATSVTHAHSMTSTAVACTCDVLPAVHYTCLYFGGPVRVAEYATFGSPELAEKVVAALEGRNAALMANHGSVAYGSSIDDACEKIELLEWHAELYWRASLLGTPKVLTEKDLEDVIMAAVSGGYGSVHAADKDRAGESDGGAAS